MTSLEQDMDLLRKFENLELEADSFGHREHLRVAWTMLQKWSPHEAMDRYIVALRRFAEHHGAAERYHETITLFYLHEIQRRIAQRPPAASWHEFAAANPELANSHREFLGRHYPAEVLASAFARKHFVPPQHISAKDVR
jgi:hypothetical protein